MTLPRKLTHPLYTIPLGLALCSLFLILATGSAYIHKHQPATKVYTKKRVIKLSESLLPPPPPANGYYKPKATYADLHGTKKK